MTVLHSSDSGDADETPLAQAWQKATPLPTKGADEMAGKLAKAFTRGGTAEAPETGYVMFNSEQAEAGVMAQPLPATTNPVPEGIPAATASKLPLTYTDKAEAAVKQTVTVRFAVQKDASAEGEPLYALPALFDALDLVRYDGADTSETVKTVLETAPLSLAPTANGTLDGVMYIADNAQYTTAGYDSDVQVGFHWIGKGVSVNAGTGGPADSSDFFPIVFYDWDGVTMLGSTIVPKVDNVTEQQAIMQQYIDEFTVSKMSAANAAAYLDTATPYDPSTATDEDFYDESAPLSNKKGYAFGVWIDFDAVDENGNEVYTNYGEVVQVKNATSVAEPLVIPNSHKFSSEDYSGVALKAAYSSNATMHSIIKGSYSVWSYQIRDVKYLQFAATSNYGITVEIDRIFNDTVAPRVRQLGLRIGLTVKGASGTVYMLQSLSNQDHMTAQFAVNDQVESVAVNVVDLCDIPSLGGTTNWATGAAGRSNVLTLSRDTDTGFKVLAGVGFFNDLCAVAKELNLTPEDFKNNQYSNSGITFGSSNFSAAGLNITNSAAGRRNAVANIYALYLNLPNGRELTKPEMQDAITKGTF